MSLESVEHQNRFNYPQIDTALADFVNGITEEELNDDSGLVRNNILQYGIDAITHIHFLRMAQLVGRGEITLEELKEMFECKFYKNEKITGLSVKIDQIERDGIFLPPQIPKRDIPLWNRDYINKVGGLGGIDVPVSHINLIEHKWTPEDLENPEILERAEVFAHDLFAICALIFTRKMQKPEMQTHKDKHIFDIFGRLLEYYTKIAEHGPESEGKKRKQWLLYTSESTPIPGDTIIHMGTENSLQALVDDRRLISLKKGYNFPPPRILRSQ